LRFKQALFAAQQPMVTVAEVQIIETHRERRIIEHLACVAERQMQDGLQPHRAGRIDIGLPEFSRGIVGALELFQDTRNGYPCEPLARRVVPQHARELGVGVPQPADAIPEEQQPARRRQPELRGDRRGFGKLDLREEFVRQLPFDVAEDPGVTRTEVLGADRKIARHRPHRPRRAARQVRRPAEARAAFSLRQPLARGDPELRREVAGDLLDLDRSERVFQRLRIGQSFDQSVSSLRQGTEHPPIPARSRASPEGRKEVLATPRGQDDRPSGRRDHACGGFERNSEKKLRDAGRTAHQRVLHARAK
jgi:hypothetical protein